MILHCVFCALRPDATPDAVARVMTALDGLRAVLPGMTGFRHGPNRDFEGKSPGHGYGFVVTLTDAAANAAYLAHPQHRAIAADLVALCAGGADGIVVYDLDV